MREIRGFLVPAVLVDSEVSVPQLRELTSGDVVYHRKISPQPPGWDRFDGGSQKPCKHGPDAFVSWSGDKCVKGMRRIYSNFDKGMLYHCSSCGMYCVRG
jgi:hypothetical protein